MGKMPYFRGCEVQQCSEAEIGSGLRDDDDEDGRNTCAVVDSSTLGLSGLGGMECADEMDVEVGWVVLFEVK